MMMFAFRDLGRTLSHVELNTPKVTSEQLEFVENECNERIRSHRPLIVHYLSKTEAQELEEVLGGPLFFSNRAK